MIGSEVCTYASVADIREKLNEIHELVIDGVLEELRNGGCDRREALQLLKQNQISAAAMPDTPTADLARMAGKLNFQTLEEKVNVVPLRPNLKAALDADSATA
jgi:hypothetical protein